ncbi:LLM class F420-dependent oxidoreductase [[Mycobacterium] wendilense]|uniref:LLM class F420-dependent oxidoreductase n=1 Tax=[Mycobacterium] wendilense TaxID=3064284 RepID=A0ABM9M8H4_9MYCO|nr:LLM class F420-dependent oxidoreductase [Mycolicibacterium sp. MU0050]CAJ1578969.1 LLM class F420-dependent oxidoreductase [Mycolicibacterium sp. MU0050]
MARLGLTVPFQSDTLARQAGILDAVAPHGFTDLWSAEAAGSDAFTPLAAAAVSHPEFRLGTAIVPAYTRGPALLAMSAAALAELAQSPIALGIGSSSDVIVEKWNGLEFHAPYQRVRDVAHFLRRAFTGERVEMECASFSIKGFRLERVPERVPKLLIAALRPGMLRLAARSADGAIVNWLSATDVHRVAGVVRDIAPDAEIVARLFVIPSTDVAAVRATAKRTIAAYLNVPVYAEFHRWLGRGSVLEPMWTSWHNGDRKGALEAIPDSLVDELFLYGTPAEIADRVREYAHAGVDTPILAVLPAQGVSELRPSDVAQIGAAYATLN